MNDIFVTKLLKIRQQLDDIILASAAEAKFKEEQKYAVFVRVDIPEKQQFPWPILWNSIKEFCEIQDINVQNFYRCIHINGERHKSSSRRTVNGWQPYIEYMSHEEAEEMRKFTFKKIGVNLNATKYITNTSENSMDALLQAAADDGLSADS